MEIDGVFLASLALIVTPLVRLIRGLSWFEAAGREKFLPLVSIAVGLILAAAWTAWHPPAEPSGQVLGLAACIGYAALHGVLAGLAASGLWSAAAKYAPLLKT